MNRTAFRRWTLRFVFLGAAYVVLGALLHHAIDEDRPTEADYPRPGDVLINDPAGERVVFLEVPPPHQDGPSRLAVTLRGGGAVPVAHIHPSAAEIFTVKSGRVVATVNGVEHTLSAGEHVTVAAGDAHGVSNPFNEEAKVDVQLNPTGQMHLALVQVHGFLHEMGGDPGVGGFLQMLRFAERYHVFLAGPPVWFQQLGIFTLAPTARALGYPGFVRRYSDLAHQQGHPTTP